MCVYACVGVHACVCVCVCVCVGVHACVCVCVCVCISSPNGTSPLTVHVYSS